MTAELKRGDLVRVQGAANNVRDEDNQTHKRPLFVSQPLLDFLKFFWDNYNEGVREFNVMGYSGVGKSCAAKILAAEVSRKRPDITLFYARSGVVLSDELRGSFATQRPAVAIIDQIRTEDLAKELGYFADCPGLTMVLIFSQINPLYFRTDQHRRQHDKRRYKFPFGNSGEDCAGAFGLPAVAFKPTDPPFFDSLEHKDPKTFLEQCEWANGHSQTLSLLVVQKKTPRELVNQTAELMREYFNQPDKENLSLSGCCADVQAQNERRGSTSGPSIHDFERRCPEPILLASL